MEKQKNLKVDFFPRDALFSSFFNSSHSVPDQFILLKENIAIHTDETRDDVNNGDNPRFIRSHNIDIVCSKVTPRIKY